MTVVDTFRVVRRQDLGGGRFREGGELMPEAHLFFAAEHWLHTGGLEEANDIDEAEFRAAVEKHCPDRAHEIYERVGLLDGIALEGAHKSPRAGALLPREMPAYATPKTVRTPKLIKRARPPVTRLGESTIVPTDVPPGAPTPSAPKIAKENR